MLDVDRTGGTVHLRRFGVTPAARGRGLAEALVAHALRTARDLDRRVERAVVVAREELPHTVRFWRRQGFAPVDHRSPYVELARALPLRLEVPTADDMRDLARRVAGIVRAGDVLVLSGDLGAGKTTFTQGLGAALGVRGEVTSPTFVIARVHPTTVGGPDLIHVDAYRLGGSAELDDLDLDTDVDHAVTVVEWGEGLAEDLADSPLVVRIRRARGAGDPTDDPAEHPADDDPRTVEIDPLGSRWLGLDLAAALT
ncbi:tRNA (adenosine(37)-N6)-threonylcarbamoyltransferase complex ATPase subunit type 1 TsaE [Nocardioides sp. TF02-7]|uniref:tRNA (adenosine(37)-N6)-threonylcarbamoyltransferase complex ATPase subunit type 1 TsaE n=1 Tax=Nocardioides sp. TF02-7 TaxID=2917724 RepID=UPI001F05EBDF|nr:tRNA (adenosine(37)-N6)-threonylcarbamoyltransferase complex ATPase subunit type 1 TsaE [Nocardioides sp. TF02-7]UMG94832.1 tRNA (adenosine(37)-N6)-threonylcarbamoyltransferase complex ATPase subunit type 1 TsaE [Nocardioides sp. TF02-7]